MATGIFFNYKNKTHELFLDLYERPTVWRATIDSEMEVFFEAPTDIAVIDIIELAVTAWVEEITDVDF